MPTDPMACGGGVRDHNRPAPTTSFASNECGGSMADGWCDVKQKRSRPRVLWLLLCVFAVMAAVFYYGRRSSVSKAYAYLARAVTPLLNTSGRHLSRPTTPKLQTVSLARGTFTFMPAEKDRFAWLVRYPDGRTFRLGDEFSSECPAVVGRATYPATIRFELDQQRACNPDLRTPIQVATESLKDVNADGFPDVAAEILTGGNVNGHLSSLISLTPTGPKLVRR